MKYSDSLKKTWDFQQVYKKGTSKANRFLVMYVLKNEHGINRLGITASKKIGNSVVRHRVTRLIRESYRLSEENFLVGYDIVIVTRPEIKNLTFFEIRDAILLLGARLHVLKEPKTEV